MSPVFSLVIPAYNEVQRLPPFLSSVRRHLSERFGGEYEVVVVDDGSLDETPGMLQTIAQHWTQLKVIVLPQNRGKGAAVRTGMLAACGDVVLFADADGATPIAEETRLWQAIEAGAQVAVGSRLRAGEEVSCERQWHRALAGRLFAAFAHWMVPVPVRDTQCGFKMFRRDIARHLFSLSQEQGYLFDLELLTLAVRYDYRIVEVPVNWNEIPGSKLSMTREWKNILAGLWRIRKRASNLTADKVQSRLKLTASRQS